MGMINGDPDRCKTGSATIFRFLVRASIIIEMITSERQMVLDKPKGTDTSFHLTSTPPFFGGCKTIFFPLKTGQGPQGPRIEVFVGDGKQDVHNIMTVCLHGFYCPVKLVGNLSHVGYPGCPHWYIPGCID